MALLASPAASGSSPAPAPASFAAQAQSLLAGSDAARFSSFGGSGSTLPDLFGLTATAQAYSLYSDPALLQLLAGGTANGFNAAASSAGSDRTAAVASPLAYAFNPFDEASWWTTPSSLGTSVDSTA